MRKSNGIVKTTMTNRITLLNNVFKRIWMALAILIILAAVFSSIFRSLTPWAEQYKGEVEHHLSQMLGQPVTVQSMRTGWYWFQPVLKLEHLTVRSGSKSLHIEKVLVGINLFKSLVHWRIQPGMLYLDNISLVFRQVDKHWEIDGISMTASKSNEDPLEQTQQLLTWLSQQDKLIIKHASAQFYFTGGKLIPIRNLSLSIINNGGRYQLKGAGRLAQSNGARLQLLGDVYFDPLHPEQTKGQLYSNVKHILPAQWQSLFPKTSVHFERGNANASLWVDLERGLISSVQAKVRLKQIAWRLLSNKSTQLIQSFDANLALNRDEKGWKFHADHIKLKMGGVTWPENQVQVTYNKEQDSYLLFVKSIILESLFSPAINWPPTVREILDLRPRGLLSGTQVALTEGKVSFILTRFDNLGWNANDKLPKTDNLSGVLHWQPEEGHLELDSTNTTIALKNYPVQHLDLLNGAFYWKELSDGLRVSVERFALSQPELTLSGQGVADQVTSSAMGHIRMGLQFSAKNLQQWFRYLPAEHVKPKLLSWLNNDLKRIAFATGTVTMNGLAKDFPFDNNNGQFSIISHAIGGELFITPKWQLTKDIEGYIKLKNRNLNIDIVNADFQGVPLKQMNLRIDDIGKDKETLLIHGIINGEAKKILNFVLASPLQEKLAKLKKLTMSGLFFLDLNLEIPLYPENDDNLVRGRLIFKDNTITANYSLASIPIESLSGELLFDEKGITHSVLAGSAFGYPLNIKIESFKELHPYTNVSIDGECTVESLKKRFNSPALSLLKGAFFIKAILKITDDPNDLDNIVMHSSLRGLAIDLPAPLGKKYAENVPLEVNVDFNNQNNLRLRANYNGRLSADILFQDNKGDFGIQSGQIRLGSAYAINQSKPGLAVIGSLDGFDLPAWKEVLSQFSTKKSRSSVFDKLKLIDVTLKQLTIFQQQFDHLSIKARTLRDNSWSFRLSQKKISADLTYQPSTNLLSGFVTHFHLDKINLSKEKAHMTHITPEQIPNLNLRVDHFTVGDINVGNIILKSQSSPEKWHINYCRIDSPVYQFIVDGQWLQNKKLNQSQVNIKLHLVNLEKALQLWNITPVVGADDGTIEFEGGWKGGVCDFSLPALNGSLFIQLKNGRITNLSPETEEKLGLGKLLSILSLQTIPRRLKLDFSDLSHEGYSFDLFKGNFNVNKGIMFTTDSYIDGPVAYASMNGSLDLVRRMYDVNLGISPHITASLPIVATIAGGPIAGVAAWVANKLINQSMQKISGYTYKISGPWSQPVVQQLSIVRNKNKK